MLLPDVKNVHKYCQFNISYENFRCKSSQLVLFTINRCINSFTCLLGWLVCDFLKLWWQKSLKLKKWPMPFTLSCTYGEKSGKIQLWPDLEKIRYDPGLLIPLICVCFWCVCSELSVTLPSTSNSSEGLYRSLPLPSFSGRVQSSLQVGNATSVWRELINEAAHFYLAKFPQIGDKAEYRYIGESMWKVYPSIEHEGTEKWVWLIIHNVRNCCNSSEDNKLITLLHVHLITLVKLYAAC